jgi:hypothetical protein
MSGGVQKSKGVSQRDVASENNVIKVRCAAGALPSPQTPFAYLLS